jgi:hypothetical protein
MHTCLLASVNMTEAQTSGTYSNFGRTNVKFNTYKQTREEILYVMERISPVT